VRSAAASGGSISKVRIAIPAGQMLVAGAMEVLVDRVILDLMVVVE
jgi:hypothetical protein